MTMTAQTNPFQNSPTKELVRQSLVNRVLDQFDRDQPLSVLSLPGDSLSFERTIARSYVAPRLVGVEKDKSIFESAESKARFWKLPIELHNVLDSEYLVEKRRPFNVVWLDYCGGWGQEKLDSIVKLVSNDCLSFEEGGRRPLLALTLSDGRDLQGIKQLKELTWKLFHTADERDQNYIARIFGVPRAINEALSQKGFTAVPKLVIRYIDHMRARRTTPMLFFLFEIERNGVDSRGRSHAIDFDEKKVEVVSLIADYSRSLLQ